MQRAVTSAWRSTDDVICLFEHVSFLDFSSKVNVLTFIGRHSFIVSRD